MSTVDRRLARGAATRARILDAAREVIAADGYAATSTRAVAERAGVNLSLVHYHFGRRGGLLLAVLAEENARLLERQRTLFASDMPLAERWRVACTYLDEDIRSGYVRILWELWSAGLVNEELAAGWRTAMAGWLRLIEETVARWTVERGIELPLPADAVATLVVDLFLGIEAELLAGGGRPDPRHLDALAAIGRLIESAERPPS